MKKFGLVFILSFLLIGCTNKNIETITTSKLPEINDIIVEDNADKSDREYILDESANSLLKEIYQLNNLNKHQVYKTKDTMNIDFFFTDSVNLKEITNSRSFILKVFILKSTARYGGVLPYEQLLISKVQWNAVNCRYFIGTRIVIEEKFSQNKLESYFENMDIKLKPRIIDSPQLQGFKKLIKKQSKSIKDVIFEKSFKGNVLVIKIEDSKNIEETDINKIKTLIENEIAPILKNESIKTFGMNADYLGIVLQLYSNEKKYYEETYFNGQKTYWFKDSWMNYKFFE
jgi:hypothetical protein